MEGERESLAMNADAGGQNKQHQAMDNNALQNFLVLQAVFQHDSYCPSAIRRNRLVSRVWREASNRFWMELHKYPVLRYSDAIPDEDKDSGSDRMENDRLLMTLPEFYSLYQSGDPFVLQMVRDPVETIVLHMWERFGDPLPDNARLDKWFWTWITTSSLHQLTLVDCRFKQEITVFKESFLRSLPNLGKLTLKNCSVQETALEKINEEYARWVECPGREDWMRARRRRGVGGFGWLHYLHTTNIPYNPGGYQHFMLHSLDVTLHVVQEKDTAARPKPGLRIWGPFLAMLPHLSNLRIGGYEETEAPPPQLKQLCGDDDEDFQGIKEIFGDSASFIAILRASWLGGSERKSMSPPPSHRGFFWELFWMQEIGQVELTLKVLDLLDFSAKAQEYGVVSTCEMAAQETNMFGVGRVYCFLRMAKVALDLGLDPVFAERDLITIGRWMPGGIDSLELYRAPFEKEFPLHSGFVIKIQELKLWGNVSKNLATLFGFNGYGFIVPKKLIWTTSCFDKEFYGKRLHHLMKSGRKAYPLMRQDLVEETDWSNMSAVPWLYHLEIDWGPISLESWRKLGNALPNLTILKGIVANDEQLSCITKLWPLMKSLEIGHGSMVSASGLVTHLPKLKYLYSFKWLACACIQDHFQGVDLQQIEIELRKQLPETEMVFPWALLQDKVLQTGNLKSNNVCILAEWENALLTGESSRFFEIYENMQKKA